LHAGLGDRDWLRFASLSCTHGVQETKLKMIHWVPPHATLLLQVGLPMAGLGVVPGLDTLGEVDGLVCLSTAES